MKGPAAIGIDVDPIALEPVGARAVALVDRHADARFFQPLRQAKAARGRRRQ